MYFFVSAAPLIRTYSVSKKKSLETSQGHGEDCNEQEACVKPKKAKNIYHVMEDELKSAELSEAYSRLELNAVYIQGHFGR